MTLDSYSSSSPSLDWKFSQVFGERSTGDDVRDIDIISAIEFDRSGDYLAIGDGGGRVVVFEKKSTKDDLLGYSSRRELEYIDHVLRSPPTYQYKTEFQSHEPEFDYLKSLEIDEKINKLRWCVSSNGSLFLLSANDRTIKLWKMKENKVKKAIKTDRSPSVSSENSLLGEKSFGSRQQNDFLPNGDSLEYTENVTNHAPSSGVGHTKIANVEDGTLARCRKVYAHAHDFNINSISNNSDGQTFISADDFMINLWNLEVNNQCFNIIDTKPPNMEDLTEVITSAKFHPFHCNLLAYSSTRGFVRLVDMRQSAICDHGAKILHDDGSNGPKSFLTEIIASISDIEFSTDGRHILTRDFMNLKLWDIHMENSPVATYKIHEQLRPKLPQLYDSDAIFDKFDCCVSGDGLHFATGSYSNNVHIFSHEKGKEGITFEASKIPNRKPQAQPYARARRSSLSNLARGFYRQGQENLNSGEKDLDLNSKLLHLAWHPMQHLIACAAGSSLYMYYSL